MKHTQLDALAAWRYEDDPKSTTRTLVAPVVRALHDGITQPKAGIDEFHHQQTQSSSRPGYLGRNFPMSCVTMPKSLKPGRLRLLLRREMGIWMPRPNRSKRGFDEFYG